jgi:hypothetical protein
MPFFLILSLLIFSSAVERAGEPGGNAWDMYVDLRKADSIFRSLDTTGARAPRFQVYFKGIKGAQQLRRANKLSDSPLVTLIDFTKPSTEKRLWVINTKLNKVVYYTYVAHGKNSGELYASKFSNTVNSLQSSLGFYITGTTYMGKNGLSLKLHGMEKGFNDNVHTRYIVLHGADYASEEHIQKEGMLGNSEGCPAVPFAIYKEVIADLKGGTCLFIFYPEETYLMTSTYLPKVSY